MARRKDFRRNYENLYPGIEKYPDVLSYLKKSDRKMEYMEIGHTNINLLLEKQVEDNLLMLQNLMK